MSGKPLRITFQYGSDRRRVQLTESAREVWDIIRRSDRAGKLVGYALISQDRKEKSDERDRKLDLLLTLLGEVKASLDSIARKLDALASAGEVDVKRAAVRDERLRSLEEAIDRAIDRFLG